MLTYMPTQIRTDIKAHRDKNTNTPTETLTNKLHKYGSIKQKLADKTN